MPPPGGAWQVGNKNEGSIPARGGNLSLASNNRIEMKRIACRISH